MAVDPVHKVLYSVRRTWKWKQVRGALVPPPTARLRPVAIVAGMRAAVGRPLVEDLRLAQQLGVPHRDMAKAIGHGWQGVYGQDDAFVFGDPMQVMLRVVWNRIEVSEPYVFWGGQARSELGSRDTPVSLPRPVDLVALRSQVLQCSEKARASFQVCNACYRTVAPYSMSGNKCHGCASRYFGVVY